MRCWIVHKFGRWKTYKAVYEQRGIEIPQVDGMFISGTYTSNATRTYTEDRQTRECQRCGYTQDRLVRER
jgi:hypothetical protein